MSDSLLIASDCDDKVLQQTLMLLIENDSIEYLTVDSGYTTHRPLVIFKPKPTKKLKVIKKVKPDLEVVNSPDEIQVPLIQTPKKAANFNNHIFSTTLNSLNVDDND